MKPIARRMVLAGAGAAALAAGAGWRIWQTRDQGTAAPAGDGDAP